jgi:uncharacterized protein YjbI with pentapeptide repeats
LSSAKVGGSALLCGGANFTEVDLVCASIDANLDMIGATFKGKVNLSSVKVGGSAFLRERANFTEVDLIGASIGAYLDMSGATFKGKVDLNSAKVGGSAFLREGANFTEVDLIGADIGSDLDVSAASVAGRVDMTGCQVKGELRLGSSRHRRARWEQTALLVLRNAHVGALQDRWRLGDPDVQNSRFRFFTAALRSWWCSDGQSDSSENSWPKALAVC